MTKSLLEIALKAIASDTLFGHNNALTRRIALNHVVEYLNNNENDNIDKVVESVIPSLSKKDLLTIASVNFSNELKESVDANKLLSKISARYHIEENELFNFIEELYNQYNTFESDKVSLNKNLLNKLIENSRNDKDLLLDFTPDELSELAKPYKSEIYRDVGDQPDAVKQWLKERLYIDYYDQIKAPPKDDVVEAINKASTLIPMINELTHSINEEHKLLSSYKRTYKLFEGDVIHVHWLKKHDLDLADIYDHYYEKFDPNAFDGHHKAIQDTANWLISEHHMTSDQAKKAISEMENDMGIIPSKEVPMDQNQIDEGLFDRFVQGFKDFWGNQDDEDRENYERHLFSRFRELLDLGYSEEEANKMVAREFRLHQNLNR